MKPRILPALVAELIGTFALCFIGILVIYQLDGMIPTTRPLAGIPLGLVGIALAHGLILGIFITIAGPTSGGHLNPAVTLGLLVGGKIKTFDALAYIIAQCLGGFLAGLAVIVIYPAAGIIVASGTPQVTDAALRAGNITLFGAMLAEAITTFFLVSAVWGTIVDPRAPKIGGFAVGLVVTADILAIGPLTGGAMNPARAFGPALAASLFGGSYPWSHMWLYWVGPIAGGVIASVIYHNLFMPKDQ